MNDDSTLFDAASKLLANALTDEDRGELVTKSVRNCLGRFPINRTVDMDSAVEAFNGAKAMARAWIAYHAPELTVGDFSVGINDVGSYALCTPLGNGLFIEFRRNDVSVRMLAGPRWNGFHTTHMMRIALGDNTYEYGPRIFQDIKSLASEFAAAAAVMAKFG